MDQVKTWIRGKGQRVKDKGIKTRTREEACKTWDKEGRKADKAMREGER